MPYKDKRRKKIWNDQKHKHHIKHLAKTYTYYPPLATPVDKNGEWSSNDPVGTVYYKRTYRGRIARKKLHFYKKYANKKVRKYNKKIHNGGSYKKIFAQYWWVVD